MALTPGLDPFYPAARYRRGEDGSIERTIVRSKDADDALDPVWVNDPDKVPPVETPADPDPDADAPPAQRPGRPRKARD